jgi:hypothetical protein
MLKVEATQKAWPLLRRFLLESRVYLERLDATVSLLEGERRIIH